MITIRPYYVIWMAAALIFVATLMYVNNSRVILPMLNRRIESQTNRIIDSPKSSSTSETSCAKTFSKVFGSWMHEYRKCLVQQVEKKTYWGHLHAAIDKCLGQTTWQLFDVHLVTNWDDTKLVIVSPNDPKGDDCTEVTLGVGNDIESEKKLRNLVPNCSFFGADPILASGKVFREIGTYFEIAVAAESGFLQASVLENGKYQPKNVSAVTLVDFLKSHVNRSKIDYMFMDNEGPEYQLLWQFVKGGLLEKERLSVCQLSVEMHGPFASYNVNATDYENLITALITGSAWVPLWSAAPSYHVRSFYVNLEDQYCVEKFFMSRFCRD